MWHLRQAQDTWYILPVELRLRREIAASRGKQRQDKEEAGRAKRRGRGGTSYFGTSYFWKSRTSGTREMIAPRPARARRSTARRQRTSGRRKTAALRRRWKPRVQFRKPRVGFCGTIASQSPTNRDPVPYPGCPPWMSSSSRASARRVLRFAPWSPHNWYDSRLSPAFQPNQTTDGLSKDERQVSPGAILSPLLHLGMQCPGVRNGVGEERRVLGGSPRHHALEQHLVGVDCKSFIDKQRATK